MSGLEFSWASGSFMGGLDATQAGEELERIKRRHGDVTAAIVVEESRPKDAVLHDKIFHVGQKEAARLHYEERARLITRSLRVKVAGSSSEPVRAYIAIKPGAVEDGPRSISYTDAFEVRDDPVLSAEYRMMLRRRMAGLRRELVVWEEFSAVVAAMDEVLAA